MIPEVRVTVAALQDVAQAARREADGGAPGGMVAVYVEVMLRHLISGHDGHWSGCTPCHRGLGKPWPAPAAAGPYPSSALPSDGA